MAGKTRHLKEKGGRFYARIAVPAALKVIMGKSELVTALGGDRRAALRLLPEAVSTLQKRLETAGHQVTKAASVTAKRQRELSVEYLAVQSYKERLAQDTILREESSAWASISVDTDYAAELRDGMAGRLSNEALNELVGNRITGFKVRGDTGVVFGSPEWRRLAIALCASEYEALERVFERDEGNFSGTPKHPVLQSFDQPEPTPPMDLMELWDQYVAMRRKEGSMQDGGRRQVLAVKTLISFTGKTNANDLTNKDISDWQDDLMNKMAVRTIAKVYIPTIRSLFSWAVQKHKMEKNPAEDAKQAAPKAVRSREAGYTLSEALRQLQAARAYEPKRSPRGKVLENDKVTAMKRWVPLLCAFSGARISELTQLRREDFRVEDERWIMRITPYAGTVKTKQYRDVPLHPQLVNLGFLGYVDSIEAGPLFHMSTDPSRNHIHAQKMANRLREWLHDEKLVPKDVLPCHGWRHRFKTVGIELGILERVINAIQGHSSGRAADNYGDVTIKARCDAIDRFPNFDLVAST